MASKETDDDRFVTLTTVHDAIQARMIGELLEQEGIPTILPGIEHRGMLGMMGAYIAVPIQVPEKHVDEARALVDALNNPEAEIEPGEEVVEPREPPPEGTDDGPGGPYRAGAPPEPAGRPKLKRVAAFMSIPFLLGLGHIYAQAYRAGFVLMGSSVLTFVLVGAGATTAGWALPVVVFADLFGSVRAVDRYNTGRAVGPRDRVWVLAPSFVPLVVLGLASPWALMRMSPVGSVAEERRAICKLDARCQGGEPGPCAEWMRARLESETLRPERVAECADCLDGARHCGVFDLCDHVCALPPADVYGGWEQEPPTRPAPPPSRP